MDANASPCDFATLGVGNHMTRPYGNSSNSCGPFLDKFLQTTEYSVPTTQTKFVDQALLQGSFLPSRSDQPILIDCIAHSCDVVTMEGSVGQSHWDTLAKCHDHFPLKADVKITSIATQQARRRRVPTYSRCDVGAADKDELFNDLIACLPQVPTFVESSSQ